MQLHIPRLCAASLVGGNFLINLGQVSFGHLSSRTLILVSSSHTFILECTASPNIPKCSIGTDNHTLLSVTASLEFLPTDILKNCIFPKFLAPQLVACSLVCTRFQRIVPAVPQRRSVLLDIFRTGSINLLKWFKASLGYPKLSTLARLLR